MIRALAAAEKSLKSAAVDKGMLMDKEFKEKLNAISEWTTLDDKSEESALSIWFHEHEDGLVRMRSEKGELVYKLKPLPELFSVGKSGMPTISWKDDKYLDLLHAIESAIKNVYLADPELTDSSVMLSLDKLSMNPEAVSADAVIRAINQQLRLTLSTGNFSRDEVKAAVRKILASVKRHKATAGIQGYLDFIMEYVP